MTMLVAAMLLLTLLFVKHWYVDFVNQTMEEVNSKGIYGTRAGLNHSFKHGVGTAICIMAITGPGYFVFCIALGILDFVLHYHIDWAKMNWGNRDIQNPLFWNHLGLDQLVHQLTYLLITYLVVM
jgi:hypothetical protein